MRDRLIELIEEAHEFWLRYVDECAFNQTSLSFAFEQMFADHLLAEGVIVPPVELGSRRKVYIPIRGTGVVLETKVYAIGIDEDADMVINPKEYPEEVISIIGYNIGKTVFLTREEAEKALAERSENGTTN